MRRAGTLWRVVGGAIALMLSAPWSVSMPHSLHAQSAQGLRVGPRALATPRGEGRGEDDDVLDQWRLAHCVAGLTYGAPLRLAASYGMGLRYESSDGPDYCALGVARVGFGGVQAGVGVGVSIAPLASGAMLTANVLRTFDTPRAAAPRTTYVGASLHLWPAVVLGGEIGYYARVGGSPNPTHGDHFVAWSFGFGY
jgi:hypothetical protein